MGKIATLVLALCGLSIAASANSYNVTFDNSICCGPPAIVGTGTFNFGGTVGDGTYFLTSLPGYNINFTVGSTTFTNANINTSLGAVLVVIYGGGTQFYFDNTGSYGSHGGSLDFDASFEAYLTTEPNYYGPPPLNLYQSTDANGNFFFGVYQAAPVPEPTTLMLLGAGAFGLVRKLRRKL
jgi:hypothetical protein